MLRASSRRALICRSLWLRRNRAMRGQGKMKGCPGPVVVRRPYAAAMDLDDRAAYRQAHAHAIRLRCEEGVEQLTDVLRADADAGIVDLNQYLIEIVLPRTDQKLAGSIVDRGHGLNSVYEQVQDHLLKLDPIAEYGGQRRG